MSRAFIPEPEFPFHRLKSVVLDPPITYIDVGRCIYCTTGSGTGNEHIIPFCLNGTQVLAKAGCHTCEAVTSYLDGFAGRSIFGQLRVSAGLRTRNPRERPTAFEVILTFADGRKEREMVPAAIHPSLLILPKFEPPNLLTGRVPDGNFRFTYRQWMRASEAFDEYKRQRGAVSAEVETHLKPQQFSRVIAKIGHAYAVARLGLGNFEPFLLDLIHARDVARAPELVGSEPKFRRRHPAFSTSLACFYRTG